MDGKTPHHGNDNHAGLVLLVYLLYSSNTVQTHIRLYSHMYKRKYLPTFN